MTKRAHRATGKPPGRPKKAEPVEGRRYGPDDQAEEPILTGPQNMLAMNEQQLRQFGLATYGRRFADDDSIEVMRDDLMRRSDVGRFARYR